MAIEIIPNQPVIFRPPSWQEPCPCDDCEDCMQVQHTDFMYAQVKLNHCSDDLNCGDFDTLSAELLTNGNFDTNLNDWSEVGGPNWNWEAGGRARHTAGSVNPLFQTVAANLDDDYDYYILFSIFGRTAGSVGIYLGGTLQTGFTTDGDYIIEMKAGSTDEYFAFEPTTDFDGAVDTVSLKRIAPCWTKTDALSTTFSKIQNNVCFSGALTENIISDNLATVSGENYVVEFTISDYVSGEIVLLFGTQQDSETFSGNGQKFSYSIWATAAGLSFYAPDGFVGCISDVHIYLLNAPIFYAVNQETDAQILLPGYTTYEQDRATIKFQPIELLPYGCHKICIIDPCSDFIADNLLDNPEFTTDLSGWTDSGNNWAWNAANGGEAKYETGGNLGALSQAIGKQNVCARIQVISISGSGAYLNFAITDGGNTVSQVNISAKGIYSICGIGDAIELRPSNTTTPVIVVGWVYASPITDCDDCSAYDYCSNCFNFKEDLGTCTLLVEGYNNENSWDFIFNNAAGANIFKLSHRLAAKLWHPTYPEESNDYTFSDGKTSDTFALSDKFWTLGLDPESERTFDVVRLQKRSDHFVITDVNESNEYWAEKGDFNPDWTDGGCKAPANIKVKLKTSQLYNNLCTE